jgi:hypothetical protein
LFEFNFVVPRDIRIPLNNGRISFTLQRKQHLIIKQDTIPLLKLEVLMKIAQDNISPKVKLYMNDETLFGGITNSSPFISVTEENGINTAGGIGHDITAVLDGDVVTHLY